MSLNQKQPPPTMADMDDRTNQAWMFSFAAAMVPFTAFCYGHSRGLTVRVIERIVKSPAGPAGLLFLPFITLGMEKSIYDTTQAIQGIDPNVSSTRGGFPSGGANLPSFSLVPVRKSDILWPLMKAADSKKRQRYPTMM